MSPRPFILLIGLLAAAIAVAEPKGRTVDQLRTALVAIEEDAAAEQAVAPVGRTRAGRKLLAMVPRRAPETGQKTLLLIAGMDGDDRGVNAALAAAKWFHTDAPAAVQERWALAVLPCANPDGWIAGRAENDQGVRVDGGYPPEKGFFNDAKAPETRSIWRWSTMWGADAVLEIRGGTERRWLTGPNSPNLALSPKGALADGSLAAALGAGKATLVGAVPALAVTSPGTDGAALLREFLSRAGRLNSPSPARAELQRRAARQPLQVAGVLVKEYPRRPGILYIPGLAWAERLHYSRRAGQPGERDRVLAEVKAWLDGAKSNVPEKPSAAALAGNVVFAELALFHRHEKGKQLALAAANAFLNEGEDALPKFGREWTDDIFFTSALLSRVGRFQNDRRYFHQAGRQALDYAKKLQREDGLFHHAPDAPHCWGRGNGFAVLGLAELLQYFPLDDAMRNPLLDVYRRHMRGLGRRQAPDGMWRQVVDAGESYTEVTVTAMTIVAMARGLRIGWLPDDYRPILDRAWEGLSRRIGDDGSLIDVCAGTGAGATKTHYLDRPAITGFDDRGGAMCLYAAMEYYEYQRLP